MLGRIYKITSPSTDKIYIGSTTLTLNKRFGQHKNKNQSYSSKEIIKYGDAQIELLEELECKDKNELRWKEREYHQQFKESCINQNRAIITEDEFLKYSKTYREKNIEKIKQKAKTYYDSKKEELLQKQKAYYYSNREEILQKEKANKARKIYKKAYRDAHKEAIKIYMKEYRAKKKLEVQTANLIVQT